MFKSKRKKLVAFVLSAFMAVGIFGTTIASANPNDNPPPPPHDHQAPPSPHDDHGN